MAVKDAISNCAVVATYKKEGGKDDARERAIEDFGTGAVWLFAIPLIKGIIDKTIYPLMGLNPKLDIRHLKGKDDVQIQTMIDEVKNASKINPSLTNEASDFSKLLDKGIFGIKNKSLYKGLFGLKFLTATLLSAFALVKIIKYKQKTTKQRIEKDYFDKNASSVLLKNKTKNDTLYETFSGKKKSNPVSFKGGIGSFISEFAYNPKLNTSILDGFIAAIRLKEGRKGEKGEIAFKEAFQMTALYALAPLLEKGFNLMGRLTKTPIELDPLVLFDKNAVETVKNSAKIIEDKSLLNSTNQLSQIKKLALEDSTSPLVEVLAKNGTINLTKDKNGLQGMSYFKFTKEKDLKEALENITTLAKALNEGTKINAIKAYKVVSVLGNVGIGIFAMGILLPKLTIMLRKYFHNGDSTNPAIAQQEKMLKEAQMN